MRLLVFALALLALLASPVSAAPRPARDGANHHLGDDSFVARFGRLPSASDGEKLRMRVHLEYVRAWLGARPATRPELAARRAELLGYLDDYIAAGITPANTYVPWRTPVFIDDAGRICAVGYLIERSRGRALPEAIAARHRLGYLEELAADFPDVARWVEDSGLALAELASIQPGYEGPSQWLVRSWGKRLPPDGPYLERAEDGITVRGAFARGRMTGAWTRVDHAGVELGRGTFRGGSGTWTVLRADGTRAAEGAYAKNVATGTWRMFYPSGRLAAIGTLAQGVRHGAWTLYYDVKPPTKLSEVAFHHGVPARVWRHYGLTGELVATHGGDVTNFAITRDASGVRRTIHEAIPADMSRTEVFELGRDRLWISHDGNHRDVRMFDRDGNALTIAGDAWTQRSCTWERAPLRQLRRNEGAKLHGYLHGRRSEIACTGPEQPVPAARAKHYATMLASRRALRAPAPTLAVGIDAGATYAPREPEAPYEPAPEELDPGVVNLPPDATGFPAYLADHMTWYVELPHVDDAFDALYAAIPGTQVTDLE